MTWVSYSSGYCGFGTEVPCGKQPDGTPLVAGYVVNSPVPAVRVVMGDQGFPVAGVKVYAESPNWPYSRYEVGLTDSNGYTDLWGQPAGASWVISAELIYDDPITGTQKTIVNYPNYDPQATYVLTSASTNIPNIKFPLPVLLQAGWGGGSSSTWKAFQAYLEQDPGDSLGKTISHLPAFICFGMPSNEEPGFSVKGYDNDGGSTDDHVANAKKLFEWVKSSCWPKISSSFPGKGFDDLRYSLIGHSMGGLIVRAFALGVGDGVFERVITLDGTHGGTFGFPTPDGLERGPLNGYSSQTGQPPTIAGWNASFKHQQIDFRWLTYGATASSVVNPDESALGYGESLKTSGLHLGSNWVGEWVRGWRVYRALDHFTFFGNDGAINTNPQVMAECAAFLKSGGVPSDAYGFGIPPKVLAPGGGPKAALEGHVLVEVSAPMGATQSAAVSFDSNGLVRGTFVVEGAGALYAVKDSLGTLLLLSNLTTTAIADGLVKVDFELNPAPLGSVLVELTAGTAEAAELNGSFEFDNGRVLVASASPMTIAAGQPVQLLASIEDSGGLVLTGTPAAFQATVRQPDGSDVVVALSDDGSSGDGVAGDGLFGGTFTGLIVGRHTLWTSGSLGLPGELVERSGRAPFVVASSGASLVGAPVESTPDLDADGLYDSLVLTQSLSVGQVGSYRMVGTLVDGLGETIVDLAETVQVGSAPQTVTVDLVVDAEVLALHAVGGPWTLAGVSLFDIDAGVLECDSALDFTTAPYSLQLFTDPGAPTISLVLPSSGPISGGNQVELNGEALEGATLVHFGKFTTPILASSEHSLLVELPSLPLISGGVVGLANAVDVTVVTPWGLAVVEGGYTFGAQHEVRQVRDCNGNGISDTADILNGTSRDTNGNGIPDECDATPGPPLEQTLYFDGFESGGLGPEWSTSTVGTGYIQVTQSYGPYSGSYHLVMASSVSSSASEARATLALDLAGESGLRLHFAHREYNDEDNVNDGIWLSSDGVNFVLAKPLIGADGSSDQFYQSWDLDLDALVSTLGLTYTSPFYIQLQWRDNFDIPLDGFAFDDIRVTKK